MRFLILLLLTSTPLFCFALPDNCHELDQYPTQTKYSGPMPTADFSSYSFKVGGTDEALLGIVDKAATRVRMAGCMGGTVKCLDDHESSPKNGKIFISFNLELRKHPLSPKVSNLKITSEDYKSESFVKCMLDYWSNINYADHSKTSKIISIKMPIQVTYKKH